jgi:hypothetical protein
VTNPPPRWHHGGVARRRPTPEPPEEPALKATKARAKELIDRGIREGSELLDAASSITNEDALEKWFEDRERWEARTKAALDSVFHGPWPRDFVRKASHIYRVVSQGPEATWAYGREATRDGINNLRSLDERLEFLEEPGAALEARPTAPGGSQVFVVHGHTANFGSGSRAYSSASTSSRSSSRNRLTAVRRSSRSSNRTRSTLAMPWSC